MRYTVIAFMTHSTQLRGPNMSQGAWRSAAAIGVSLGAMLAATGDLLLLAALPFLVALDWATRQRRDFARRLHHRLERGLGSLSITTVPGSIVGAGGPG